MTDHVIKEKYIFEETGNENGGKRLVYKCVMSPTDKVISPLHVHPLSDEKFVVLEGEVTIEMNGVRRIYKKGEKVNIKRGTPHTGYNNGKTETVVLCTVEPAYTMGEYIYSLTRLSNMGKTNSKDLPNVFMVAAMGYKYKEQAYLPKFIFAQRWFFRTVGCISAKIFNLLKVEF